MRYFVFPPEQTLIDLVLFFESIANLLVSNITKVISKESVRSCRSFRENSLHLARIGVPCRLI